MPDNRYRSYLEGSPNQAYLETRDGEVRQQESLVSKLLLGIAAAAGGIAVASRLGLIGDASRFVGTYGRAVARSLSLWQELRQPGFRGISQEISTIRNLFKEELKKATERPLQSQLERLLAEKESLVNHTLPFHLEDAFRFAELEQAARQQFGDNQAVREIIYSLRPRELTTITLEDFLARATNLEVETAESLYDLVQQYGSKSYRQDNREFFYKVQREASSLLNEQIRKITASRQSYSWLTGFRPATLDEVLRSNIKLTDRAQQLFSELLQQDKTWGQQIFDPRVVINAAGEVEDWRSLGELKHDIFNWLEPTLPGRIFHLRDFIELGRVPHFFILERGALHPGLTNKAGEKAVLGEAFIYAGGKVAPLFDPTRVAETEFQLISARFGLGQKLLRNIADIGVSVPSGQKWYDRGIVGRIRGFLDIGYSTSPTVFKRLYGFTNKFADTSWFRNVVEGAVRPETAFDTVTLNQLQRFFEDTTPGVTRRTLRVFLQRLGLEVPKDSQETIRLLKRLAANPKAGGQIKWLYRQATESPEEFLRRVVLLSGQSQRVLTAEELVHREIAKEIASRYGFADTKAALDAAYRAKQITKREYLEALQVVNAAMFEATGAAGKSQATRQEALQLAQNLFRSPEHKRFQDEVLAWARRSYPLWSAPTETPSGFQQHYTIVRRGINITDAFRAIKEQNDWTKLRAFAKQFAAGRSDLEDVTQYTIFPLSPYHLLYRLNEGLSEIGLGFSGRSTSSSLDLALSFAFKRVLPVVAGWEAFNYIDWVTDRETGYGISERWARTVARTKILLAPEDTTVPKHIYSAYPYLEQMAYWPIKGFPFIGGVLSRVLFGIGPESPRTKEEQKEYYRSGYQEVRRGRYWLFGSRTPWWGSKVDYYLPNEYLMTLSDWRYSSTMYPNDTYWRYNWLPTPTFPLAPLNRLLNPYFFEKLHYYDRLYPLTGPAFEELTPWGPLLNATIGVIIKPQRVMHREEVLNALNGNWPPPAEPPAQAIVRGLPSPKEQLRLVNDSIKMMAVIKAGTATPNAYVPTPSEVMQFEQAVQVQQQMVKLQKRALSLQQQAEILNRRAERLQRKAKKLQEAGAISADVAAVQQQAAGARNQSSILKRQADVLWLTASHLYPGTLAAQKAAPGEGRQQAIEVEPGGSQPAPPGAVDNISDYGLPVVVSPVGSSAGAAGVRNINAAIKARGEFVAAFGRPSEYQAPQYLVMPTNLQYRLGQLTYVTRELSGIYGFLAEAMVGSPMRGYGTLQTAASAYSLEQRFWESNIGGLGGELSEIGRRFLPHRLRYIQEINPIKNTMPSWLPGADYYIDYQRGDAYAKIPYGEVRLPGEAYMRTHQLHPDAYGVYGAVDRFLILADVAPYSQEARYWRDVVTHMKLPADLRHQVAAAKRRMSAVKKDHTFYPYHFVRDITTRRERVHVTRVLDYGMFLTAEYPENPIRVAGVRAQSLNADELAQYIHPGQTVTIAYDPNNKISNDTYQTIRAVVYMGNSSLARELINKGIAKESYTDFSTPALLARFTPAEIQKGAFFERLAHLDTPFNSKFLNVRSPLESYLRERVYGKDGGDWTRPWSDWLKPTIEAYASRMPPIAALSGAATGYLIGQILFGGRGRGGAILGGTIGLFASLARVVSEWSSGQTWIPERVRRQREIEEYFDILAYIKAHGLYEQARRQARLREGVDVEKLLQEAMNDLERRRQIRDRLMQRKRALYLAGDHEAELKKLNKQLADLQSSGTKYQQIGPWTALALKYHQDYTSTLYGFEPGLPFADVMRALPSKDREYFQYFLKATPEEQQRLLKVLPANQRRIYQYFWGMKPDARPSLEAYFKTHYLPPPEWPGWRPDVNLEDVKIKVIQNEALDIHDFDLWESDVQRAAASRISAVNINRQITDFSIVKQRLYETLNGLGLYDISVDIYPSTDFDVQVDLLYDRSEDIRQQLKQNFDKYLI
ncbi:hypothetical protein MTAT_20610 [Moorella thermoacetica]|uniref:Uncharacterized protein n=1 Tax=Neomoorella thermoacetica TaxID=1525 RepID=A0AAC9HJ61_NEOTH|nr:hypothetical protein [Moorella thermoacetica]AOQ24716.1 hypothetical protein Maut_02288 [Moorella thermoacetica]TYL12819.1 hypothetical protein MTAT_20610 [Moorella thermoacetica]